MLEMEPLKFTKHSKVLVESEKANSCTIAYPCARLRICATQGVHPFSVVEGRKTPWSLSILFLTPSIIYQMHMAWATTGFYVV
jgi:hypothetical protein